MGHEKELGGLGSVPRSRFLREWKWARGGSPATGYYRTQRESGEITVKDRKASDNPLPESQPGVAFESESLVENVFEGQWLTQRIEPDKRGRL